MMIYDLIVVGSGPAGLFAAGLCGKAGLEVLLIEKNDRLGLKLLASGSGQCNISNTKPHDELIKEFGDKERFVRNALYKFGSVDLIQFFEDRGVEFETTSQGKIFPKSRKAIEILDALRMFIKESKVEVIKSEGVESLEKDNEIYKVVTSSNTYSSKSVLIATGGKSYPNLGTTGDGYKLAKAMGHKIVKAVPSLTPVFNPNFELGDLSGMSFRDIDISVYRNQKKVKDLNGDLLITHKGLSGPVILNNSRDLEVGDTIQINFVGFRSEEDFRKGFEKNVTSHSKSSIKKMMDQYDVPKRLTDKILELTKTNPDLKCAELPKQNRKEIMKLMQSFPFEVTGVGDFNIAMATHGGVSTKEINSKTYESRVFDKLYFAGEVIDVDGNTGGYNIQFAFSSAYAVYNAIINE